MKKLGWWWGGGGGGRGGWQTKCIMGDVQMANNIQRLMYRAHANLL